MQRANELSAEAPTTGIEPARVHQSWPKKSSKSSTTTIPRCTNSQQMGRGGLTCGGGNVTDHFKVLIFYCRSTNLLSKPGLNPAKLAQIYHKVIITRPITPTVSTSERVDLPLRERKEHGRREGRLSQRCNAKTRRNIRA